LEGARFAAVGLSKRGSFWKESNSIGWSSSFTFDVAETDTMYFAHVKPYTYGELRVWMSRHPPPFCSSALCRSQGEGDVAMISWEADDHCFLNFMDLGNAPRSLSAYLKPLLVSVARHYPGESVASYTIEGFMDKRFGESANGNRFRHHFSFVIIPMINVDGVIYGHSRPSLTGYNMNRSWVSPEVIRESHGTRARAAS
jgi:hypothetical protein